MAGHETGRGPGGTVMQAAIPSGPPLPAAIEDSTLGRLLVGTVLAVYFPEEDTRPWARKGGQKAITCDVRIVGANAFYLHRVPVYQRAAGMHDEDLFVPRAATVDVTGSALVTDPTNKRGPSAADNTDADLVLIGFRENNSEKPFIFPVVIPHPSARNIPEKADGRVRRMRHHGTIFEIDSSGNVSIDTTGAAQPRLAANGDEVANADATITLTSQKQVSITSPRTDLSESPTDWILMGDTVKDAIDTFCSDVVEAVAVVGSEVQNATALGAIGDAAAALSVTLITWLSDKVKTG